MMDFADKLNFMFELTNAEGKELAAAMHITPPGISKMRNGLRGLPRNREAAYSIALFFAQRCKSNNQREALAKGMQAAQVLGIDDDEALADIIFSWFQNEKFHEKNSTKDADAFLHRLNFSVGTKTASSKNAMQPLRSSGNNIFAYYGMDGKRAAYMTFWQYLLDKKKAFDICVLSDEDNTWIDDDPSYSSSYYDHMLKLTEQGCFFRRIVGPLNNMAQAFYSLNRWFPLYLTGKAISYYYKYLRDDLNRITVFVVSDVAAMYSFSVGKTLDKDCVTFFTTDTQTVNTMSSLYKKYLTMCSPATKTYSVETAEEQMHERLLEYEGYESTCMQLSTSLSFITIPWEVAVSLRTGKDTKSKDIFLASFAKRHKLFTKNLEQFDFFDFIRLANVDDVMKELVPIPAGNILGDKTQFYSPNGYLQHLKSIEFLIKRRNHYHAIIDTDNEDEQPIIYVKEEFAVIITRAITPFVIFDVTEHNLIKAFTENLRRNIPDNVFDTDYRKKTLTTIQSLIGQLEERIAPMQ